MIVTFSFQQKCVFLSKDGEAWKKIENQIIKTYLSDYESVEFLRYLELEKEAAFQYGLRLLAEKAWTTGTFRKKLTEKGLEEGSICFALEKITRLYPFDDEARGTAYAQKEKAKGTSPIITQGKLTYRLMLPHDVSKKIVQEVFQGEALLSACRKALQKMRKKTPRQQIGALLRRGFSYEIISQIMGDLNEVD